MADTNRRDALKLTAGAVLAAGLASDNRAAAQEPTAPLDAMLVSAKSSPHHFMLSNPVVFKIEGGYAGRDLVITSALDENGKPAPVHLRSQWMRVFRADAGVDEFTKGGGLYWRFNDKSGKVQLPKSYLTPLGAIVLVVREDHDTVRCYTMVPDMRC